jgi:hypothetical protein
MSQFSFRIQGPGIDLWEVVEADDLDYVLNLLMLAVDKFKRDASAKPAPPTGSTP